MEAEQEVLQERIDNWERYLEALRAKWQEQQHLEDERLLKQLLNADTEAEIRQKITDDMEAFNIRAENGFDTYTGIFDNFIAEYRSNLEELQKLSHMQIQIMDATNYLTGNNSSQYGQVYSQNYANQNWKINYQNSDYMQDALDAAARGDLDAAMQYLAMRRQKVSITGQNYDTTAREAYDWVMKVYNSRGLQGYAEGIENGPITETGPAMLHGTPSNPEYVLNSDQAYNLLENLATTDSGEIATETVSPEDESTAQGNVTGQARTELEGINKIIQQISAMINAQSLTNSNLTQITEILRNLQETQNLLSDLVNQDYTADAEHFHTLMSWLQ